jgi:tight adherence protein B
MVNLPVMPSIPAGMALLFGLAVFLIFIGLQFVLSGNASTIETRLGRYTARQGPPLQGQKTRATGNRFGRLVSGERSSAIATELARADLKLTPGEYVLINLAAVVACAVLAFILFRANFILALVGGIVGFYLPRLYIRFLQRKRVRAFNGQLGDTIILLSNSLRSGYSLLQSMETVAKELAPPMSTEFARVTREVGLGLTIQEALANMLRRIPSDDLDLMITAINVQHEVGGNLAEILDSIALTIRERVRILGEIRTLTAQQRLSGYVLSVLPVILALVMYALNPSYVSRLWQDVCGLMMIGVGALMIVAGYIAIRKITNIEV